MVCVRACALKRALTQIIAT